MLFGSLFMAYVVGVVLPIPGAAQVNIGINIAIPPPPPIVIAAPPRLVVVPGTVVSYAPAVPHNYFFYGRKYYVLHDGAWFFAPAHHGPWTFIAAKRVPRPLLRVPVAYYKVPPGHLKKQDHGKGHGKGHKHKKHKGDD
jgi:hypothetical protein